MFSLIFVLCSLNNSSVCETVVIPIQETYSAHVCSVAAMTIAPTLIADNRENWKVTKMDCISNDR